MRLSLSNLGGALEEQLSLAFVERESSTVTKIDATTFLIGEPP